MSPTNTFLFPKIKFSLKGCRFESVQEIQTKKSQKQLTQISSESNKEFWEKLNVVGKVAFMQ